MLTRGDQAIAVGGEYRWLGSLRTMLGRRPANLLLTRS